MPHVTLCLRKYARRPTQEHRDTLYKDLYLYAQEYKPHYARICVNAYAQLSLRRPTTRAEYKPGLKHADVHPANDNALANIASARAVRRACVMKRARLHNLLSCASLS